MTTALASPAPEAIDVALCAPAGPVSPEGWIAHRLHALDRDWPETNCELDHWIELAAFNGLEPEAMLGFTVAQDYLGDQFTLLVPPKEDLRRLYGASADMYALYGHFEDQIVARTAAGGVIALDTDAFYLPDSFGVSYRRRHVKTTIAIQAVRPQERSLDYFHNLGFWRLEGEDYDMVVFRPPHLQIDDIIPPYAELIRFERDPMRGAGLRAATIDVLRTHLTRAPKRDPIPAFGATLADRAGALGAEGELAFHDWAFHTLRQLGANHELLGEHLAWLGDAFAAAQKECRAVSSLAKTLQFQMARAVARSRAPDAAALLAEISRARMAALAAVEAGLDALTSP